MTSKLAQGTTAASCATFKRMRLFVCTLLLGLVAVPFAARAAAPEFVIARDGKAEAVIVVHGGVTNGVRYAANELAEFLSRISGARFMVADKPVPGYRTILVGTPYKPRNPEELCVRVKDANTLEVTGDRSRGVLYAAYELLEHFGVVFCARDFDYVPRISHLALPGDFNMVSAPYMYATRGSWSDTNWHDPRFSAKLREHLSLQRATRLGYPDLAADYDIDVSHVIGGRFLNRRKYFNEHPEWYAQRHDGSRNALWVCLSNEGMWQQLIKEVGEYLAAHPGARECSLAVGDGGGPCVCDGCMKLVRQYLDPDGAEVPHIQYDMVANRVGRHFAKDYPKVRFNILAYGNRQPAHPDFKLEPNVGGCSAELWRNHCLPADCNEYTEVWFNRFQKLVTNPANGTYIWDYLANFRDFMIPFPNQYIFAQSARFYKNSGVRGVSTQTQFCGLGNLSEMQLWTYNKLLWNPDADIDKLIDTYVNACYGPGAKHVREYINLLEHARLRQRFTWFGCYVPDTAHYLTDEDCVKIYRALDRAAWSTRKDPVYGPRCRRASLAGVSLAIWRYQDMLAPAEKMKVKLPSLKDLYYTWHAIANDSASARYHKMWSEGGADYGKRITQMFDKEIVPTNRTPAKTVLRIAAKDLTGGKRMTRHKDPDGTEYCQFKTRLAGERVGTWYNPGEAEIGYTATAGDAADWYVFAGIRVGATVAVDPTSCHFGIYQSWFPNGFKCGGRMEVANRAVQGRKDDRAWHTVALGKRRITDTARIWVMPGHVHPVEFVDVKDIVFVDPRLIEGSVANPSDASARPLSVVIGHNRFDRDRNVRIEQNKIDNYRYARLANFNTNAPVTAITWTAKAGEAGDWDVFAKVRIGAAFALDQNAAVMTITTNAPTLGEPLALTHVNGSEGDEAWQIISLGRQTLAAGTKVNLVPRAAAEGEPPAPRYVDMHSVILLNPDYLAKTQPALPEPEKK